MTTQIDPYQDEDADDLDYVTSFDQNNNEAPLISKTFQHVGNAFKGGFCSPRNNENVKAKKNQSKPSDSSGDLTMISEDSPQGDAVKGKSVSFSCK